MNIKRFTGLHLIHLILETAPAASLLLAAVEAHAVTQEPEQLASVGPVGGIIFGVLFLGFCVIVVWMMMKQKDPAKKPDEK